MEFYRDYECNGICKIITKSEEGINLCIDGSWGVGKTRFCLELEKKLFDKGYKTIYFDAFKSDFQDDPLIAILSEMAELNEDNDKEFLKQIAKYASPLVKTGIKAAVRAVSFNILKEEDLKSIAQEWHESASETLNRFVEDSLAEYAKKESSIKHLETLITERVIKESQGLVVIVDELDRCRPTYALEVIEKIKHVFNIPKVTFVISMHKKQMVASIENLYGKFEQTETYLEKFLDFTFYLDAKNQDGASGKYCTYLLDKKEKLIGLENEGKHLLKKMTSLIADFNDLTFRECEKFIDSCIRVEVVLADNEARINNYELHVNLIIISGFISWAKREEAIKLIKSRGVSDDMVRYFIIKESFRYIAEHQRSLSPIKNSKYINDMRDVIAILLSINHNMNQSFTEINSVKQAQAQLSNSYEKNDILEFVKEYMRAGCGIG